ncbi:MAG: hypothetical protein OEY56_08000 [Cyclobacteriaceae bacterium]|nr:hypothetical protein [Cyclobacteriaceae bacterium]
MTRKFFGLIVSMLAIVQGIIAQESETFTDEEITTYASVMKWAEDEKVRMGDSVEVWVKSNENLSGAMYNDLSKAAKSGDLSSAGASEAEIAIYNEIQQKIEDEKNTFKEVYVAKIKDEIGAGLYNRLNKALKTDGELKARYEAILTGLEGTQDSGDAADAENPDEK